MWKRRPFNATWALAFASAIPALSACGGGSASPSSASAGTAGSNDTAGGTGGTTPGTGGAVNASGGNTSGGNTSGGSTSGGSTSGGTSNGGGPARAASPCSSLPAAGTWENITPPGQAVTTAIAVDPFDSAIVWATAQNAGLFKSTDCGANWNHVNVGDNGSNVDNGSLVTMAIDPVDQDVIYVAAIYGSPGLWKSTNGGVDWTQTVPLEGPLGQALEYQTLDGISMDPSDHRHLVVGTHTNCKPPHSPACEGETTDGGATWSVIDLPTKGWEEGAGPWVLNKDSWVYSGSGLWLTTDHGAHWQDVTAPGTWSYASGGCEIHSVQRTPQGDYLIASLQGIVTSADGKQWSLISDSGGRKVGLTQGDGRFFASDQWSPTIHTAPIDDPKTWTAFRAPPIPADSGFLYVAYDEAHHILYGSGFAQGIWRIVVNP